MGFEPIGAQHFRGRVFGRWKTRLPKWRYSCFRSGYRSATACEAEAARRETSSARCRSGGNTDCPCCRHPRCPGLGRATRLFENQQQPCPIGQVSFRVMPQSVVADPMEASWQDVLQESPKELDTGQSHGPPGVGAAVLRAERHVGLVHCQDPRIADGRAEYVSRQVVQHGVVAVATPCWSMCVAKLCRSECGRNLVSKPHSPRALWNATRAVASGR